MHVGSEDVLLNLSLDFKGDVPAQDIEAAIKKTYAQVTCVFIEAQAWRAHKAGQAAKPQLD